MTAAETLQTRWFETEVEDGAQLVHLHGTIDLDNAADVLDELSFWAVGHTHDDFIIDLAGLERVTSVLLALLIELTSVIGVWRGRLTIRGATAQIRALAEFYGMSELLRFEE